MNDSLTCQELVELITEYLEGAMPAADRDRFDRHLTECRGCNAYLAQMRQTIHLAGRLIESDLAAETRSELLGLFRDWKAGQPG